jgi:hypothetical protein
VTVEVRGRRRRLDFQASSFPLHRLRAVAHGFNRDDVAPDARDLVASLRRNVLAVMARPRHGTLLASMPCACYDLPVTV